MKYRVTHNTTYQYPSAVSVAEHAVHLTPRSWPHHRCLSHDLFIDPTTGSRVERQDYFGNHMHLFSIEEPHYEFCVEAVSLVEIDSGSRPWPAASPDWEHLARSLPEDRSPSGLDAYQFVFESPRIRLSAEMGEYAKQSFSPGRALTDAVLDLTERIYRDFKFDSCATTVSTPVEEVFRKRRGVCQDFAHLQITCLRSLQLPARYVSGYLRTYPPPGRPRMQGGDASHAWLAVYCPGAGWLDVDPTNNVAPSDSHITVAWGRDFGDVSPVRGIILGSADHKLKVSVDVEPLED